MRPLWCLLLGAAGAEAVALQKVFSRATTSIILDNGVAACDYCKGRAACEDVCSVGKCEFHFSLTAGENACKDWVFTCATDDEPRPDFFLCEHYPDIHFQCNSCVAGGCDKKCFAGQMEANEGMVYGFECADTPTAGGLHDCAKAL